MISSAILLRPRSGRARDCSKNRTRPCALRARLIAAEVCRPQRNLRMVPARFFKSSASTIAVSLAMVQYSGRVGSAQSVVAAETNKQALGTSASTTRLLQMPDAPPRLELVFPKYDPPLFFVTFNTHHRKKLLASAKVHAQFVSFAELAQERGIAVGRYVIMPDHVHLFVSGGQDFLLTQWVRLLKRSLSKVISSPQPHWQRGILRSPDPSR
jgi:hypothetical protein